MAAPLPDEETTASPAAPGVGMAGTSSTPAPRSRRLRAVKPGAADAADPLAIAKEVVTLASDKGAADVLLMDIRKQAMPGEYLVICTGDNERQIRAISRGIQDGVDERWGLDPAHKAGAQQEQSGWVVLDYASVIVHILSPQMREFYRLERLWSEAATLLRMQ